ncbi:MAG: hypothetical protein ACRYGA_02270 [Janthinobacterium lividum]
MNDELVKWRVLTKLPGEKWRKRGLFETKANALAKARRYRSTTLATARVERHVVASAECAPVITGGL